MAFIHTDAHCLHTHNFPLPPRSLFLAFRRASKAATCESTILNFAHRFRGDTLSFSSTITLILLLLFIMMPVAAPRKHTTRPMITGSSVLGMVYDGGVMLASDTLLSYGSMAKSQGAQRLRAIEGTGTVIGGSGEFSDFTKIIEILENKAMEETRTSLMDSLYADTSQAMTAASTWNYLRMIMYSRRNKMNPYWNDLLVAGSDLEGKPFLGMVDLIGTTVKDNFLATGFGAYMALPLMREKWRPDLSEGEARAILEDCMKVLFYRDCRASSQIQIAKCDCASNTVLVSKPYQLETYWDAPDFVRDVAHLEGDGGW
jgi:20S proteasome subunit beta 7